MHLSTFLLYVFVIILNHYVYFIRHLHSEFVHKQWKYLLKTWREDDGTLLKNTETLNFMNPSYIETACHWTVVRSLKPQNRSNVPWALKQLGVTSLEKMQVLAKFHNSLFDVEWTQHDMSVFEVSSQNATGLHVDSMGQLTDQGEQSDIFTFNWTLTNDHCHDASLHITDQSAQTVCHAAEELPEHRWPLLLSASNHLPASSVLLLHVLLPTGTHIPLTVVYLTSLSVFINWILPCSQASNSGHIWDACSLSLSLFLSLPYVRMPLNVCQCM